jgi:hypothetical protein
VSNGFVLNEDAAYEQLAKADMANASTGRQTAYAVVCQHDPTDGVGSHGGFFTASAKEAVDKAKQVNDLSPEDHACRYVPVAVGIDIMTAVRIMKAQTEVGPEDREQGPQHPELPAGGTPPDDLPGQYL